MLVILAPLALGLAGLLAFPWSPRTGRYDDLDGAAWCAIAAADPPPEAPSDVAAR